MAQTTTFTGGTNFYFAVSVDGSAWTDCSGTATKVEVTPSKRMNGLAYTGEGDKAVIAYGKLEPVEVTVTLLYTKTSGEGYDRLADAHDATGGTRLDCRFAPEGNSSGNEQWTSTSSKTVELGFPSPDAGDATPKVVTGKWLTYLTRATI
jgi:hypothetical protein